jgi:hypothetical protein
MPLQIKITNMIKTHELIFGRSRQKSLTMGLSASPCLSDRMMISKNRKTTEEIFMKFTIREFCYNLLSLSNTGYNRTSVFVTSYKDIQSYLRSNR